MSATIDAALNRLRERYKHYVSQAKAADSDALGERFGGLAVATHDAIEELEAIASAIERLTDHRTHLYAAPPSREERLREAATAIDRFNRSIDSIEVRCMAADGPVTPTLEEMTDAELADIWADLQTIRRALSHANGGE